MTDERVIPVGKVGPQVSQDGYEGMFGLGKSSEAITAHLHGKYYTQTYRGNVFVAASQAATTWSVALNTTHTGLVVYNPITSGVNLSILQVGFTLTVAPVAVTHIGLFGGGSNAGIATHTTPLVPYNAKLGGPTSKAGADAAATLVGTPVWLMPFLGGFTAGALFATSPSVVDMDGSILVTPGYYCGIGSLTAAVGFASLLWEEIPV